MFNVEIGWNQICCILLVFISLFFNGFKLNLVLGICSITFFFFDYSSIHIHYMDKSIGTPPSNERFDYFSNFHEYKS